MIKNPIPLIVAFLVIIFIPGILLGQKPGTPDETFGDSSIVFTEKGQYWAGSSSLGLQSDGKILLAGTKDFLVPNFGTVGKIFVYRYTSEGIADLSFGDNGSSTVISPDAYEDKVVDLCVMENDDFFLLVQAEDFTWPWNSDNQPKTALLKFQANGFPDASFGNDGRLNLDLILGREFARNFEFYQDRFILAGMGDTLPEDGIKLTSFTSALFEDGNLDKSYAMDGTGIIQAYPNNDNINGLAIQKDRKFVVVGTYQDSFNNFFGYALKFLPNGDIDVNFGDDGVVILKDLPNTIHTYFWDVALQGSNILIAGHTGLKGSYFAPSTLLVRYDASGNMDNSFGQFGVRTDTFCNDNKVSQIEIGDNNEIYIGGQLHFFNKVDDYHDEVFIVKYDPNGTPDAKYGENGLFKGLSNSVIYVNDMKIQPDGKQLIAGSMNVFDPGNAQLFIQRVNGNPSTSVLQPDPGTSEFSVKPNIVHAGDRLQLTFSSDTGSPAFLQLLNTSGQIVKQYVPEMSQDMQIAAPDVPGGLYFLTVGFGQSTFVEKILIMER